MFSLSLKQKLSIRHRISALFFMCFVLGFGVLQSEEIDFFALPSPNEIMADAESQGLKVKLSRGSIGVIKLDLDTMVTENPVLTSYHVGRIFSVAGYGFKKLNNEMILKLAGKVLKAMKKMDLPQVILNEINDYYDLMVSKKQWDRNELMLSFTSARASLLYLLKDSNKIGKEDQARVQSYAAALEYGIWFQSLELALDSLEKGQNEAFQSVYLDEDYLTYFRDQAKGENSALFKSLSQYNQQCLDVIEDEVTTDKELEGLKSELAKVIEGGVK